MATEKCARGQQFPKCLSFVSGQTGAVLHFSLAPYCAYSKHTLEIASSAAEFYSYTLRRTLQHRPLAAVSPQRPAGVIDQLTSCSCHRTHRPAGGSAVFAVPAAEKTGSDASAHSSPAKAPRSRCPPPPLLMPLRPSSLLLSGKSTRLVAGCAPAAAGLGGSAHGHTTMRHQQTREFVSWQ